MKRETERGAEGKAKQGNEKEAGKEGGRELGICAASHLSIRGPLYVSPTTRMP